MPKNKRGPESAGTDPSLSITVISNSNSITRTTKAHRILALLIAGESLNRFEAIGHSDTCLNSTVSGLQQRGIQIERHPEIVCTRRGYIAHVKRYSLLRSPENLKRARALLVKKGGAA